MFVYTTVTPPAQRDQIFCDVLAAASARHHVMDL
jgi:hypothetical protein